MAGNSHSSETNKKEPGTKAGAICQAGCGAGALR